DNPLNIYGGDISDLGFCLCGRGIVTPVGDPDDPVGKAQDKKDLRIPRRTGDNARRWPLQGYRAPKLVLKSQRVSPCSSGQDKKTEVDSRQGSALLFRDNFIQYRFPPCSISYPFLEN